jgi:hypothetical protein
MLDDDEVALVLVGNADLVEEKFGWLAHDHGAEELTSEPGSTTRGDAGLDNGYLEVGTLGGERKGSRETA